LAIATNRPEIGHGASYTWVDAESGQIVAADLTGHHIRDRTPVPVLLAQIDHPVASICADGAYDRESVYEAAQSNGGGQAARVLIPPPRDARLRSARQLPCGTSADENGTSSQTIAGAAWWKIQSTDSRRS